MFLMENIFFFFERNIFCLVSSLHIILSKIYSWRIYNVMLKEKKKQFFLFKIVLVLFALLQRSKGFIKRLKEFFVDRKLRIDMHHPSDLKITIDLCPTFRTSFGEHVSIHCAPTKKAERVALHLPEI